MESALLIHILAAALSVIAMAQHGPDFYIVLRFFMFLFGMTTAWHAWMIADPLWIVLGFALSGAIFILHLGILWTILNPLMALAYIAHALWIAWKEFF